MISFLKYTLYAILLVLLQVLIINRMHLHFLITPLLYVGLIISLPFNTPKFAILLAGFFMGMGVDCFENTLGMHAAATTFAALIRIWAQSSLAPREGYDITLHPSVNLMGGIWYLKFSVIIILGHAFLFCMLDFFNFTSIWFLLVKVMCSTVITFIILFFSSWAFGRQRKRNSL